MNETKLLKRAGIIIMIILALLLSVYVCAQSFTDTFDYQNNRTDHYGPWLEMSGRNGTPSGPWYNMSSSENVPNGWYHARIKKDPKDKNNNVLSLFVPRENNKSMQRKRSQAELRPFNGFPAIPNNTPSSISFRFMPYNHGIDPNQDMIFELKSGSGDNYDALAMYVEPSQKIRISTRYANSCENATSSTRMHKTINELLIEENEWYYVIIDLNVSLNDNGLLKIYMKKNSMPSESDLIYNYMGKLGSCKLQNPQLKDYKFVWVDDKDAWQESKDAGITHREYLYDDFHIQNGYYDFNITPPEEKYIKAIIIDTLRLKIIE